MKLKHSILAVGALIAAINAHAISLVVTSDVTSAVAGSATIDFDSAPPPAWSYTGGAEFNASISGITARPPGSTGDFWSVGITAGQTGPGIVTIAGGASYYGFLIGSPDGYNTVQFFDGGVLLGSYTGTDLVPPANGNQAVSKYVNVYAGAGETLTSVRFLSSSNAFETDNHAFVAAPIPEPSTYALMLAGLAAVAFIAKRRKATGDQLTA
jgi:hypothetical protein